MIRRPPAFECGVARKRHYVSRDPLGRTPGFPSPFVASGRLEKLMFFYKFPKHRATPETIERLLPPELAEVVNGLDDLL